MDVKSLVCEEKDLNLGGKSSSCNEPSLALVRSGESRNTTTKQDVVCRSLDQLPIGILHKVIDHLDLVALVCLKGSNRHFYTTISIDPSLLSVCIRWRIHINFWNDRSNQRLEKACMLCKTKRKRRHFRDKDERFVLEAPSIYSPVGNREDPILKEKISHSYLADSQWDKNDKWIPTEWILMDSTTTLFYRIDEPLKSLIESYVNYTLDHMYYFTHGRPQKLDPKSLYRWYDDADGQCYDHLMEQFGLNKTIEALLPLIQLPPKPVWLRFTVLRCAHCGRCVEEGDPRVHGCLNCFCDVCPRQVHYQHYRTGPRRTANPQIRRISMDEKGSVWIHEVGNKEPVPVLLPLCHAGSGKLDPQVIYYAESPPTVHPRILGDLYTQEKLPQIPPKIEILDARAREPTEKSKVEEMTNHVRMRKTPERYPLLTGPAIPSTQRWVIKSQHRSRQIARAAALQNREELYSLEDKEY